MAFFSYPDAQRYPPGSLLDPHVCDLYQFVGVMESVYDYVGTQGVSTRKDVVALKPLNALALFVNLPAIDLSGANQLRSQETKREEISRDGNNDIFDTHPLHTAQSLAVQGMHAQFFCVNLLIRARTKQFISLPRVLPSPSTMVCAAASSRHYFLNEPTCSASIRLSAIICPRSSKCRLSKIVFLTIGQRMDINCC